MEHSSRGDRQPLQDCRFIETAGYVLYLPELSQKCRPSTRGTTRSLLPVTFSTFRNYPRSAIRAQEEVLDPCCATCAQPSPWFSSLDQSKRGIGWATVHYKVIPWLLCLSFCVDKLSELQISLVVVNLVRPIHCYLMRCAGNSHSAETSEIYSGHESVTG